MSDLLKSISAIAISDKDVTTGKDEGVLNKITQIWNDLKKSISKPGAAFEIFEKNLLFLKSFGVAILIILALVNYYTYKDVGLISKKPGLFALESGVFGLSGVVPFVMLCFLRNKGQFTPQQIATFSVALFVVFFILNYVLEMGGIYAATFYEETEANLLARKSVEANEGNLSYTEKVTKSINRTSDIVLLLVFLSSFLVMCFSASFVKDFKPQYVILKEVNPYAVFFVEMILFGVMSAVPIFFMASNREALSTHTTKEFLLIVLKFAALHCLLQASGFYTYIFTGMPPVSK